MRIIYYAQRYRPEFEAISKEIQLLSSHFSQTNETKIHDLHLDGLFNFTLKKNFLSAHFLYYPFLIPSTHNQSKKTDINHIYTSLGDLPYLNILNLKNTILTAAASCSEEKIKKRLPKLQQLKQIIVESEYQEKQLLKLNIPKEKITIIHPPVDLTRFSYQEPEKIELSEQKQQKKQPFTILYASCPTRKEDFEKRGINLIAAVAKEEESTEIVFDLAWRSGALKEINQLVEKNNLKNIHINNEIVADMNTKYGKAHCTIIPYTQFDDYLKLIPNSAIESLAAGKPILVSEKTEMANIVKKTGCGIVFEPTSKGLSDAIKKLRKNYSFYQKQCRKTAQQYFSKDLFLEKYTKIYKELIFKENE